MRGDSQVRFLGEGLTATSSPYPTTLTMHSTIENLCADPLAGFDYDAAHREGWTLSDLSALVPAPGLAVFCGTGRFPVEFLIGRSITWSALGVARRQ